MESDLPTQSHEQWPVCPKCGSRTLIEPSYDDRSFCTSCEVDVQMTRIESSLPPCSVCGNTGCGPSVHQSELGATDPEELRGQVVRYRADWRASIEENRALSARVAELEAGCRLVLCEGSNHYAGIAAIRRAMKETTDA